MRFDTPVYFRRIKAGKYNPDTGNHEPDTITEEKRDAAVTDSSTETMSLVYGALKQGSLTVRLQTHYSAPFDCIRIGQKTYHVDRARKLRVKHVFVVSEVQ